MGARRPLPATRRAAAGSRASPPPPPAAAAARRPRPPAAAPGPDDPRQFVDHDESSDDEEFDTIAGAVEVVDEDEAQVGAGGGWAWARLVKAPGCGAATACPLGTPASETFQLALARPTPDRPVWREHARQPALCQQRRGGPAAGGAPPHRRRAGPAVRHATGTNSCDCAAALVPRAAALAWVRRPAARPNYILRRNPLGAPTRSNADDILTMPWAELRSRTAELLEELGVPVSCCSCEWNRCRVGSVQRAHGVRRRLEGPTPREAHRLQGAAVSPPVPAPLPLAPGAALHLPRLAAAARAVHQPHPEPARHRG